MPDTIAMRRTTVFNRFSIRQALVIVTLVAIVAAVLREIRVDSGMVYAILLAPTLLYVGLHVAAIIVRPVVWLANRPISVQAFILLVLLTLVVLASPWSINAWLPVAVLWVPQFAFVQRLQAIVTRRRETTTHRIDARVTLVCISTGLLLLVTTWWAYSLSNQVTGRGAAFGRYWVVLAYDGTTEFQWAEGYEDVDWQWTSSPLSLLRIPIDRDSGVLGITRYRIDNCVKVRFPFWLQFAILTFIPCLWLTGVIGRAIGGNRTQVSR